MTPKAWETNLKTNFKELLTNFNERNNSVVSTKYKY
jgi:hypothetical protein